MALLINWGVCLLFFLLLLLIILRFFTILALIIILALFFLYFSYRVVILLFFLHLLQIKIKKENAAYNRKKLFVPNFLTNFTLFQVRFKL